MQRLRSSLRSTASATRGGLIQLLGLRYGEGFRYGTLIWGDVAIVEVLSATYDEGYEGIDKEGALIEEGIQVILTELGKAGPRAAKIQPGQLLDPSLIEELSKEGFIKALWSR